MRVFVLLWLSQVTSQIGASLTGFALGVWAFKTGGDVGDFALTLLFAELPGVLLAPVAGALADRLPRKLALVASDLGAVLGTAALAVLLATSTLELWHVYAITCAIGVCRAVQWPAFTAAAGELAPKEKSDLVAGLMQAGEAASLLVSPIIGGMMLVSFSVASVLYLDLAAMIVANVVVLLLPIDARRPKGGKDWRLGQLAAETSAGIRYLRDTASLRRMLGWMMAMNFLTGVSVALLSPMLLTVSDERVLGLVNTCGGAGLLLGGALYATRGNRYSRERVITVGTLISGAGLALVGLAGDGWGISAGYFVAMTAMSLTGAAIQSAWLRAVPQAMFGRVFAVRRMLTWSVIPIAYVTAGPLVQAIERALASDGPGASPDKLAPFALAFLALAGGRLVLSAFAVRRRLFNGLEFLSPGSKPHEHDAA